MSKQVLTPDQQQARKSDGKFGPTSRSEAGSTDALVSVPSTIPDHWEPNYDVPVPQANDLHKVGLVTDAVEAQANTDDAVADALGVVDRQGAYYARAAEHLGLVESDTRYGMGTYHLTSLGRKFERSSDERRADMLSEMTERHHEVEMARDHGVDEVSAYLQLHADLGETTAKRRAATFGSWAAAGSDRSSLQASITSDGAGVDGRSEQAAQRARTQLAEAAERRRSVEPERKTSYCPSCFMQLPETGVCSCGATAA